MPNSKLWVGFRQSNGDTLYTFMDELEATSIANEKGYKPRVASDSEAVALDCLSHGKAVDIVVRATGLDHLGSEDRPLEFPDNLG